MRISDWSSDVCSSGLWFIDLQPDVRWPKPVRQKTTTVRSQFFQQLIAARGHKTAQRVDHTGVVDGVIERITGNTGIGIKKQAQIEIGRASVRERCVTTCRFGCRPDHKTKKNTQ